ncbi:hypothetical protein GUJ93_ZPchr0008g12843 [Zizania palustris]|uniref:NAC domain-containing protein n=1 Tax=Zizania palustris TaxID=103762 RepID=A0A8J5RM97_ZIZPA|nr:hypothetical protein GUJ93_ZPchr0008g12843 [Zizania palustris]
MTHPSSSSSSAPPAAAAPAPAEATSLAPGFRFHPTDEELVSYYLKRKVLGRTLKVDAIAEVDLYKVEPWDLPARSRLRSRDSQWYFFSRLDRKHANRARTNRATAGGYWKTTGKDREVRHGSRTVGMKKTLVFHAGRAPKGERTNWVMHEYRLEGDDASGNPQDSFVVCRIFHKAGPGPQNGAQYGAPFVEEEWEEEEEEEEDDDDVGLLPVERQNSDDHEVHGSMEKGYLQMSDLIQNLGDQNENGNLSFPVSDTSNNMLNENMVSNANIGDAFNISSPNDGFLELKDFADDANLENSLGNESTIWPSDGWPWKTPDCVEAINEASTEFPPFTDEQTFHPYELEQLLQSLQEDSHMGSMCDDGFRQLNGFLGSPAMNLSGIDKLDDGMPYYDAMDDNTFNDILGSVQQSAGSSSHAFSGPVLTQEVNNTTYTYSPTQKVLEPNFVVGAPSSARLSEAGSQLNYVVLPDSQTKSKSMGKHFVKMLDSISAPPAFAAEFPANHCKSLAPISGAHPNTIRVSAEVISIGSLSVASRDKWSLEKDQGMELLFSAGFEPDTRVHCGCNTITAVLRGGFCLFFFSAIMLLVSYEVGMCIYGK